jgi:hypothetical protein
MGSVGYLLDLLIGQFKAGVTAATVAPPILQELIGRQGIPACLQRLQLTQRNPCHGANTGGVQHGKALL